MSAAPFSAIGELGTRYAAAWTTHRAEAVAAFFAPAGEIAINGSAPSVGRPAIAAMAQDFFDTYPDLVVTSDDARRAGPSALFAWTLEGTHHQSGHRVRIGGWEEWTLDQDGLIVRSRGWFDAAELERQIAQGFEPGA